MVKALPCIGLRSDEEVIDLELCFTSVKAAEGMAVSNRSGHGATAAPLG